MCYMKMAICVLSIYYTVMLSYYNVMITSKNIYTVRFELGGRGLEKRILFVRLQKKLKIMDDP